MITTIKIALLLYVTCIPLIRFIYNNKFLDGSRSLLKINSKILVGYFLIAFIPYLNLCFYFMCLFVLFLFVILNTDKDILKDLTGSYTDIVYIWEK